MEKVTTAGIDLAKRVFALHGVDGAGRVGLRKTVRREQLMQTVAALPPCLIGMEACSGAHEWARRFQELGHTVRLIRPEEHGLLQVAPVTFVSDGSLARLGEQAGAPVDERRFRMLFSLSGCRPPGPASGAAGIPAQPPGPSDQDRKAAGEDVDRMFSSFGFGNFGWPFERTGRELTSPSTLAGTTTWSPSTRSVARPIFPCLTWPWSMSRESP